MWNVAAAFDIETSSFYNQAGEKTAIMYEWTFIIEDLIIYGRHWEEFIQLTQMLTEIFELSPEQRLFVGVHNLSFELQFLYKRFKWKRVFCVGNRQPVSALTEDGILFRCTYLLSGLSLDLLAKEIGSVAKLKGDLDYSKIRHSETPMSDEELQYCFHDVIIVRDFIRKEIKENRNILRIPLTKTGYVRRYCRERCIGGAATTRRGRAREHNNHLIRKHKKIIQNSSLTVPEYEQCKRAYIGGHTHADSIRCNRVYENAHSLDICSSYPYHMMLPGYPIGEAYEVKINSLEELERYCQLFCCIFDICLVNVQPKVIYEHYIPKYKCINIVNGKFDNGKVVSADRIEMSVTNVDWDIIKSFYTFEDVGIGEFRAYAKGYLPTAFVKSILELYKNKTELKGLTGETEEETRAIESLYQLSKGMVNSAYGMCAMDVCKPTYTIENDEWIMKENDLKKSIASYNKSMKRFLMYQWAPFITAWSRASVVWMIHELKTDFLYCDTDSCKFLHYEKHAKAIKKRNEYIIETLKQAAEYHNLPLEMFMPKTKDGIPKPLGVWELETEGNPYKRFKTLGAKRYLYEDNDGLHLTCAGVSKIAGRDYLLSLGGDPFEHFKDGLYFPAGYSGKLCHTYIDETREGVVKDYLGNYAEYKELSCVHLEPTDYHLSMDDEYLSLLRGIIREEEYI